MTASLALAAAGATDPPPRAQPRGRVLLVDSDPACLQAHARSLAAAGFDVEVAPDGLAASSALAASRFDVVVSDIAVSGLDGLQLLRTVRERDLDLPVILTTAQPAVDTAVKAVEYGALRYLTKPIDLGELEKVVRYAAHVRGMAELKRLALEHLGAQGGVAADRAGLEATFERAFATIWMAFQPIVQWQERTVFAYEALMRSEDAVLTNPGAIIEAATNLSRLGDLGQRVRGLVAEAIADAPTGPLLFINLHPQDLLDEKLYAEDAPLSRYAHRCVLEITERMSLDHIKDARARIGSLRMMGYRIAVDDVGAGYAGLASVAQLEPEIIKMDISLVRNVDREPLKRRLVASMVDACNRMGIDVIAEGVETAGERDALADMGCNIMQGYFFARPGRGFGRPALDP